MAQRSQPRSFTRFLAVLASTTLLVPTAYADDLRHKPGAERAISAAGEALAKPEQQIKPGLAGSFLSGRFAKRQRDLTDAAKYLSETLSHDPDNQHLQHEAMRMNLLAGNVDIATGLAKKLAATGETDPLVACLLMLEQVKAGDYTAARTTIDHAPQTGLFGLVRPVIVQWIQVAAGTTKGRSICRPPLTNPAFSPRSSPTTAR